jgi:PKD repeat protein
MKVINFLTVAIMLLFGASSSLQAQCSASFSYTNTGNSYDFTTTVSAGILNPIYVWTIDDYNNNTTNTVTTTSSTLNYNFTGGSPFGYHYACLTVYDSLSNCQTSFCDSVYTNTVPCAGFTATHNHSVSGNVASFTSNVTGGAAPYSYAWNFHGLGTSTVANPSFTYPGAGWYAADLVVLDANGCQSSSHDSVYIAGNGTPCANASAGYQYSVSGNSASFYSYTNGFFPPFVQYAWDFGNGNYSYTANPTTQLATGWNYVCLTVTDSICTETYCDTIYVSGNTSNPCANHSVSYTSSNSGNVVTLNGSTTGYATGGYYMDANTNTYLGVGPSLTLTLVNGTYSICYHADEVVYDSLTNAYDTCSSVDCNTIYVNNNNTPCNTTVSFFDSSYVGGTDFYAVTSGFQAWSSYYWDFGNGTVSYNQYPNTSLTNGWHYVCLTVSDSICTETYCDSVYVNNGTNPCAQNSVTFDLLFDNYAVETSWTVTNANGTVVANGGNYSSAMNGVNLPINLCLPTGCYNFNIYDTYGDGICCLYGQGDYALVDDATGQMLASGGSFAYSETTSFCVGGASNPCGSFGNGSFTYTVGANGAVTFTPVNTGAQFPMNYAWDFGNNNISTSSNPTFTFANGYHLVCVTADSGNCTYTYCDTIMVTTNNGNQNGPCANLSTNINITQDTTNPFSLWMQPVVNGAAQGAGFTFVWDFGDNTGAISGSPAHIYNGFGSYVVCLMALDTVNNCVSTFCDTITVDSFGNFSRNIMKPGFTVNTLPPVINFFTSTSEVEASAMTINLFPNPANNVVNLAISSEEAINGTVSILDITGKVAYTSNLNVSAGEAQVSLPVDQLPSGVYLVRITSETTQQTMKFIKK